MGIDRLSSFGLFLIFWARDCGRASFRRDGFWLLLCCNGIEDRSRFRAEVIASLQVRLELMPEERRTCDIAKLTVWTSCCRGQTQLVVKGVRDA